ncbi:MAG: hypothetical protein Kow00114_14240 [Kiloniellaceae bacterium]
MSILRDERLVALHDLVEACRSSASHAALAAELMAGDSRAAALQALADQRAADADFFAERMIAEGDIPGGPPEERSLLDAALARARAAFADEGWAALLADCRAQEETVCRQAQAAQGAPLRDDERIAAEALAGRAQEALQRFSSGS